MRARRAGAIGESEFRFRDVQERLYHNRRSGRFRRRWIWRWAKSCVAEAAESDRASTADRFDSGIGVASTIGWSRYFLRGGLYQDILLYGLPGEASHVHRLARSFQPAE